MGLIVKDLSIQYHGSNHPIIKNISFNLQAGQCLVINGSNGSGKSTLIRAIAKQFIPGTLAFAEGTIETTFPIVSVYQRPKSQLITFRVDEELASSLSFQKIARPERIKRVNEFVQQFRITHLIHRDPKTLSSGEQQVIVILSAIISSTDNFILLLDEPISLLDGDFTDLILQLIQKLLKLGNIVIIADSRMQKLHSLNYHLLTLPNDIIEEKYEDINNKASSQETKKEEKSGWYIDGEIGYTQPLFHIKQQFPAKGIVLIKGPNGVGKTTLLLTISQLIPLINGELVFSKKRVYLPQDTFSFFWKRTIADEIDSLNDIPLWMESFLHQSPFVLSEGQRKKVALQIIFQLNQIILIDEPSQSLDTNSFNWLIQSLLKYKTSKLIIISSNDIELIERISNFAKIIQLD